MLAVIRGGVVVGLLVVSAACGDPPLPSTPTPVPSPVVPAPPPPTFPPLEGASDTYVFSHPLDFPVQAYTSSSKYVLYETGAFALEYSMFPRPYVGAYRREENRLLFTFAGDVRWGAIGTIAGDSLEIRYSDIMSHSDFENAVYTLAP